MDNVICHIAIVGCGLGGLAAAIALKRQGHDVMILEQAAHLNEVREVQASVIFLGSLVLKTLNLKLHLPRLALAFRYRRTLLVYWIRGVYSSLSGLTVPNLKH